MAVYVSLVNITITKSPKLLSFIYTGSKDRVLDNFIIGFRFLIPTFGSFIESLWAFMAFSDSIGKIYGFVENSQSKQTKKTPIHGIHLFHKQLHAYIDFSSSGLAAVKHNLKGVMQFKACEFGSSS